ncbi:MAG: hypothetical protein IAI50_07700, partial [Candidatus Eremiobacteraeota bacterium]|nr:hypothetical protein [Candidatus Eremiobacteraeota bacterium]
MRIFAIVKSHDTERRVPTQDEIERTGGLIGEMASDGSLIDAGGTWPGMLEMQITRRAGEYSIVEGPFSEAKEVVGGYLLL